MRACWLRRGCGTTRLALCVAHDATERYEEGAQWIALAQVVDPAMVVEIVCADELTPRQREVVILVAQAKKNEEIAEELVLSRRTVETHVSHILAKLDFTSRAQIVRWAMQSGLVKKPDETQPQYSPSSKLKSGATVHVVWKYACACAHAPMALVQMKVDFRTRSPLPGA